MMRSAVGSWSSSSGRAVDGGGVEGADALHGGVEVVEGFLLDHGGDLRGDAAEGFVFVDEDGAVGFADALEDGFLVERTDAAEVDDFGGDVEFFVQAVGGGQGGEDGASVGDEGDVGAFAFDVGHADGDDVIAFGDFALLAVEEGVFHDADGVVVADGGLS